MAKQLSFSKKLSFSKMPSFSKMHGAGNDFVVVATLEAGRFSAASDSEWSQLSRKLLDRHFGIGADQLMLIRPSKSCDFSVSIFNADGSSARMCGNGVRCVARYLKSHQLANSDELLLDVAGQPIRCDTKRADGWVSVDMGVPEFNPAQLGLKAENELIGHLINLPSRSFQVTVVGISGSLHCVTQLSTLAGFEFEKFGPLLERDKLFPDRANIEFVEKVSDHEVRVRVWERGSGPTLACGSGACAVVAALARQGMLARRAQVEMPGGVLEVNWGDEDRILLSGPTEEIFQGELTDEFLETII